MTWTFTANEAIRRAKMKADMKNSNFISNADWYDFFNEAWTDLYDLLIETSEEYWIAEDTITLTGVTDYALPTDFYKSIAWDLAVNPSSNIYTTIKKYNNSERNKTVGNVANIPSGQIRLLYYPIPVKYDSGTGDDPIEGVAGYEKMIVTHMAAMALEAEESSSTALRRAYDEQYRKIQEAATNRSMGEPGTVSDSYVEGNSLYHPTLRYRLQGNTVRFLTTTYVGV